MTSTQLAEDLFVLRGADSDVNHAGGRELSSRQLNFILACLLVLTAVPRLCVLGTDASYPNDAFYYFSVGEALAAGDFEPAFSYLSLNFYTALLAVGSWFKIDPLWTGVVISQVAAILTPIPLFGWVRRLYGLRPAVCACVLFAVHPKMIRMSTEPLRESLFWLFFVLTIYLLWKAVTDNKLRDFLLAGVALALAVHTRSEGWLLVVPVLCWPLLRAWRLPQMRTGMLGGIVLCFTMWPALVFLTNITLLQSHTRWELGRLTPISMGLGISSQEISSYLPTFATDQSTGLEDAVAEDSSNVVPQAVVVTGAVPAALASTETVAAPGILETTDSSVFIDRLPQMWDQAERRSLVKVFWNDFIDAINPLVAFMLLVGTIRYFRDFFVPEKAVLSVMFALLMLAVAARLMKLGEINGRYMMTGFFIAAGLAGMGMNFYLHCLHSLLKKLWWGLPHTHMATVVLGLVVVSIIHLRARDEPAVVSDRALGRQIAAELPDQSNFITSTSSGRLARFIAGKQASAFVTPASKGCQECLQAKSGVLLLETFFMPRADLRWWVEVAESNGFRITQLPALEDKTQYLLLTKQSVPASRVNVTALSQTVESATVRQ
ncbi:glycosyltransferase family 39 protein [Calycomorphotria hydatis]|uniref:Dolichyl-phosphate-mannose-protein mannosyltransferase n=1 Tax=Calycomorphotria hydatis TaxID=2528027 RepID=A0A517T7C8_9PLAN|nr:glycosyltransferase family 39 protein [Calycomorphotria hydatis]QDT64284.1 Dolichyl-phosphate-mannose-protein mannosyltransferase [Calycomorphotria hydatis]